MNAENNKVEKVEKVEKQPQKLNKPKKPLQRKVASETKPREDVTALKTRVKELERQVKDYKNRLDSLRKSKSTVIVKTQKEYIQTGINPSRLKNEEDSEDEDETPKPCVNCNNEKTKRQEIEKQLEEERKKRAVIEKSYQFLKRKESEKTPITEKKTENQIVVQKDKRETPEKETPKNAENETVKLQEIEEKFHGEKVRRQEAEKALLSQREKIGELEKTLNLERLKGVKLEKKMQAVIDDANKSKTEKEEIINKYEVEKSKLKNEISALTARLND